MKLKLKITELSTPNFTIEEKEFETIEKALTYIDELEQQNKLVRCYEVGSGKRIVGGVLS